MEWPSLAILTAMLTSTTGPITAAGPVLPALRSRPGGIAHGYSFGPFVLDCASGQLFRDGQAVKIRPQVYEVLCVLAANRDRYVSPEQLMQAWSGTAVCRHTVGVTIREARRLLGDCGAWVRSRRGAGYLLRVPPSELLIRRADHLLRVCSRQALGLALDAFTEAIGVAPEDHRGFEGQASCYLLQAAFGLEPPSHLAPRFRAAHQRATALVGSTPSLRSLSAQAMLAYEGRVDDAVAECERIIDEEPLLLTAHVCKAFGLIAAGDLDGASRAIASALAIDPLSSVAASTELSLRIWRGETDRAVARGHDAVELHPFFPPARLYYGQALELSGELTRALEQYRLASVFMQQLPWARSLEAACLVKMGRLDDARAIRRDLHARRRTEYVDPYAMARIHLALGSRQHAFDELSQAVADRVGYLFTITVDPLAEGFKRDRRYRALLRRAFTSNNRRS
jgi:DNA-binding winged helix-turn-helix (wHTH) protein